MRLRIRRLPGRVVLLTHLIPGTSRGWHLIIDTKTFA
jgi:hypothetical protein